MLVLDDADDGGVAALAIDVAAVLHVLLHDVHAVVQADGKQQRRARLRRLDFADLLQLAAVDVEAEDAAELPGAGGKGRDQQRGRLDKPHDLRLEIGRDVSASTSAFFSASFQR